MALDVKQTQEMLIYVAEKMISMKEVLTKADQAIGDGDHGIGMARGFEAVQEKLTTQNFESVDALFQAVGMALIANIGGASGAVFGTLFRAGGKSLAGETQLTTGGLARFLKNGLEGVMDRGKAKVGDKTMIDALEPAWVESEKAFSDFSQACIAISLAAERGVESTKDLVATTGKAKTLGERSLGYPDPGAISMAALLKFMAEYVSANRT
jgi:dihydroxyacetone kinase-like protein